MSKFDPKQLSQSVIAVPPMARDQNLKICVANNRKLIQHIESGGVRSLLYGGNAVLYHVMLSEYGEMLEMLSEIPRRDTVVIPSVGPAYGLAMDQVEVLKKFEFPTAMLLPAKDITDVDGIATGIRHLAESFGKPIVVYLKFDRWLPADLIGKLDRDGLISWIKYAVVRDDPAQDPYLHEVLGRFPKERVVSGIGEQPAIVHLREFGVESFTSGCVCVSPKESMQMLRAIQSKQFDAAESIRGWYAPLEDLRNQISPIRVLHHAVEEAGIATTGPISPMLSPLAPADVARIRVVAQRMRAGIA
jgi:dihydrodipicolinate synthase/N-acetylneuraminate lyase